MPMARDAADFDRLLRRLLTSRVVAVLSVAGSLAYFAPFLPWQWRVLGWCLLILVAVILFRRAGAVLFGPVLFFDLARSSRTGQQNAQRWLYATLLAAVLFGVYWSWNPRLTLLRMWERILIPSATDTSVAHSFFAVSMSLQLIAVLLLTPLYTAGAIAEEKERRTLDLIFVTDLSNREIIFGLLGARLASLFSVVLAGLPILSFVQMLGGIDPNMVLAVFTATIMIMLSLGALSILISVNSQTSLTAMIGAYLALPLFVALSPLLPLTASFSSPASDSYELLLIITIVYGSAHVLVSWFFVWMAAVQLRQPVHAERRGPAVRAAPVGAVPTREGWGPFESSLSLSDRLRGSSADIRPEVDDDPLLWKERYVAPDPAPAITATIGFISIMMVIGLISAVGNLLTGGDSTFAEVLQSWIRWIGTFLICFMLVVIAISAAARVSRERACQTLDNLLTVPAERSGILFAKWLSSILTARHCWWCLGGIWLLGALTGALNWFALPLLTAAAIVYMVFMASLGLWFSTLNRSILRASLFTLLSALVVIIVPFASLSVGGGSLVMTPANILREWRSFLLDYGLNPIGTLWTLSFRAEEIQQSVRDYNLVPMARILAAIAGLHLYLAGAAVLWLLSLARLRAEKGPRPRQKRTFRSKLASQVALAPPVLD
jgi:ABC-type transport system involved in multi-copper enzyme maturation permease subunit